MPFVASITHPDLNLTSDLQSLLAGLRWRIRLYIWLEGLAVAVIWLAVTFWVGFALDYLPVLMGSSEMPLPARAVLLVTIAAVLAVLLYRFVLRRTFVPLNQRSLALILERRFSNFRDSLVTTVELADQSGHAAPFSREMLARTAQQARHGVDDVRLAQVFNNRSLFWKLLAATLMGLTIVGFYAADSSATEQAMRRLYLLSDEPWPRSALIEVVGIEVTQTAGPGETSDRIISIPFKDKVAKVAKGANVALKVRAALAPHAEVVPQQCTIYYRGQKEGAASRGERGSVVMTNYRDTDESRIFWCDHKPFKGILATLDFDVLGYDHRLNGYRLEAVDSPAIVETSLDLTYPKYMVDEAQSRRLPAQNQPYLAAGTFIPLGTDVILKFKANKPLQRAEIVSAESGERTVIEIAANAPDRLSFAHHLDPLAGNVALDITLIDADNVLTERPHRIFLTAVEDQPPLIETTLKGIGSAVTPNVIIPVRGKVTDDYDVAKTWFDLQINERPSPRDLPIELKTSGAIEQQIDFRNERAEKTGLEIEPGSKLVLTIKAADRFDLAGEPHIASGDRFTLDVVTPEELLAQLEVREVGLRRRFEQIIDEMTQLRDSLLRAKASLSPGAPGEATLDAGASPEPDSQPLSPEKKAEREAELRVLRVQRAIQQSQKSVAEARGVAAGFLDIREELINNRVDTEERKNRLQIEIADPLNKTCNEQFPKLDERLAALEARLRAAGVKASPAEDGPPADQAIDQANTVLSELEAVLAKMQDLETYNELLEIVRDLLKDQDKVIQRTQQERKRQTLEDLRKLQ